MPNINTGNFNRIFTSSSPKENQVKKPAKAQPYEPKPDSENPSGEKNDFSDGKKAAALFNDSSATSAKDKEPDSTDITEDNDDYIKPLGNNLDITG